MTQNVKGVSMATPGHRRGGQRTPGQRRGRGLLDHWTKAQSKLASVFDENGKGVANKPLSRFLSKTDANSDC